MLIPCPVCGQRDLAEFAYQGDATRTPPALDADTEIWAAYVWERNNPCGLHDEFWSHQHGCGHWLKLTRDTLTHHIHKAVLIGPWHDHEASITPEASI